MVFLPLSKPLHRKWGLAFLMFLLLIAWLQWRWPRPGLLDPVWQADAPQLTLKGRLGARVQQMSPSGCRSLLLLDLPHSGRSDLILP
ncbi:hypothetical protein, partial [Synechococcus sp. UW140]|uniref:hypothetical protein n=1 Tax=Synechococcus sp. UW140 TaxID=368503 RepID=UPI0025F4EE1B